MWNGFSYFYKYEELQALAIIGDQNLYPTPT